MEKNNRKSVNIILTGDIVVDTHIYEGEKYQLFQSEREVKFVTELGGAYIPYKILKELNNKKIEENEKIENDEQIKKEEKENKKSRIPELFFSIYNKNISPLHNSVLCWKPYKLIENHKEEKFWRSFKTFGYGTAKDENCKVLFSNLEKLHNKELPVPNILVLDDGGHDFRTVKMKNSWLLSDKIDWIILKMTRPVAGGDLWNELLSKFKDKLIVVISAEELRKEDLKIARGYSWEQTIEDIRELIYSSPNLIDLMKCRHTLINFSAEGTLWLNNSSGTTSAELIYDSGCAEGEWSSRFEGQVYGYMSCFTASIVERLSNIIFDNEYNSSQALDLFSGIENGLSAMRNLLKYGHGIVENNSDDETNESELGFPSKRLAEEILNRKYSFSRTNIPWNHSDMKNDKKKWMIADISSKDDNINKRISHYGLAFQVLLNGEKAISNIPHVKFGNLISVDRNEIETLRRLRNFMVEYRDNKEVTIPISFGIFGPPGAGKSFGVKQICNEVFGKTCWLEFNISQFTDISDLYGAFHQIRDKVLKGIIPVAFMDEFDSQSYQWLKNMLSPMQTGDFQEGQLIHYLGKCIFIFAGATKYTYDSFGYYRDDENDDVKKNEELIFKLHKGPDFKSRLDSYYDVLGPNQKTILSENKIPDPKDKTLYLKRYNEIPDPEDKTFFLRRALFIRSQLRNKSDLPLKIDYGLANALLKISKYKHGARSLSRLISLLMTKDFTSLTCCKLPSSSQLSVYVDPDEFEKLYQEGTKFQRDPKIITGLARDIHESYREHCIKNNKKISERINKPYDQLDEDAKDDNRAAALRRQQILLILGLKPVEGKDNEQNIEFDKYIKELIEQNIELLAEQEHKGWWKYKKDKGWKYGEERNDDAKVHPCMKRYSELSEKIKDIDRNSVRNIPDVLNKAGYHIEFI